MHKLIKKLYILWNDIKYNEPLSHHTNFKIWWTVHYFLIPKTENIFIETIKILKNNNINFKILWNWSNLIIKDWKLDFWVISTNFLNQIELLEKNKTFWKFYIQSWANLSQTMYLLAEKWFGGWENLAGIPGTIWWAIYMNAWAYWLEIKEILEKIKVLDTNNFEIKRLTPQQAEMEYRKSIFQKNKNFIILGGIFKLQKNQPNQILKKIKYYNELRFDKQPLEYPSAGSIFKRPKPNFYVWTTIDKLWLKWTKIWDIMISTKHAWFMINLWNWKYDQLIKLINKVKKIILKKYWVDLEIEPEIWE